MEQLLIGSQTVGLYEAQMLNYAYTVMNLTREGLDRAVIARSIWESCAIPSILYCTEAMVESNATIRELEQIQNMVGRLILQVPSAISRALAWLDTGLKPIEDRIKFRKALFIYSSLKNKHNQALFSTFLYLLECPTDKWTKSGMGIEKEIGLITNYDTPWS